MPEGQKHKTCNMNEVERTIYCLQSFLSILIWKGLHNHCYPHIAHCQIKLIVIAVKNCQKNYTIKTFIVVVISSGHFWEFYLSVLAVYRANKVREIPTFSKTNRNIK